MATLAVALDQRHEGFDAVHDALEIDVDDPVPFAGLCNADHAGRSAHAGIVADDMDLAVGGDRFERGGAHASPVRNIADDRRRLDLFGRQPLRSGFCRFFLDVCQNHIHAGAAERACHAEPDSARASCDERGLSAQFLHGTPLVFPLNSLADAILAPSHRALSFAQQISGTTAPKPAEVSKPQSVPAMMRDGSPIADAACSMRIAITSGCSM